jgi:hypothetical protein
MRADERPRRPWQITVFAIAVIANYVVQVPYALHLYGTVFSRTGALLLVATLGWFVVALWLFRRGSRGGYWLLVGYALVQLVFYLDSEVLMSFRGFGLPYHLAHTSDLIVWLAFVIGDLNFIAAGIAAFYLIRHRRTYLRPTST